MYGGSWETHDKWDCSQGVHLATLQLLRRGSHVLSLGSTHKQIPGPFHGYSSKTLQKSSGELVSRFLVKPKDIDPVDGF